MARGFMSWISVYGPPSILQTDNGREFCSSVIRNIAEEYGIKIILGRPRTPRTQRLVEQANGVVEDRIAKWKRESGRSDWTIILPKIALSINCTKHEALKKTPYEITFSMKCKINQTTKTEVEEEAETRYTESESEHDHPTDIDNDIENGGAEIMLETDYSGSLDQKEKIAREIRRQAHESLEASRSRMVKKYNTNKRVRTFDVGEKVSLKVPRVDRHATDDKRLPCYVLEVPCENKYRLQSKFGVLNRLYPACDMEPLPEPFPMGFDLTNEASTMAVITLHEAAQKSSTSEVVAVRCKCKKVCSDSRCRCKKSGVGCSVHCHDGLECENMVEVGARTEVVLI